MLRRLSGLLLRRLGFALISALAVSVMIFLAGHYLAGDPCIREGRVPPHSYERCMHLLLQDRPFLEQYLTYLRYVASGSVSSDLMERARTTLMVGGLALALAIVVGIYAGTVSALGHLRGRVADAAIVAAVGVPSFVFAGLILVFADRWMADWTGGAFYYVNGWGQAYQVPLPVIALSLWPAGFIARLTRGGILEAMRQEYVGTARAKGLAEGTVMFRHILRNGILPAVSQPGPIVMATLGGSIAVEAVFMVPGLGSAMVGAIFSRNYEWMVEITAYFTILQALFNALSDMAMSLLDPRISA